MRKPACITCFVLIFGATAVAEQKDVPKELVQYVRDADKVGLKAPQIRQNALKAGWPEATVEEAIKLVSEPAPAATSPTPAATPQPADSTAPKQAAVETASHTQPVNDPPKQLPTSPS